MCPQSVYSPCELGFWHINKVFIIIIIIIIIILLTPRKKTGQERKSLTPSVD